ncbi:MAG: hypothetical protein K6F11_00010 [Lachnospiraceae bacterium]|nr:hypothetical protein [Lachnospiraceae bacterium]
MVNYLRMFIHLYFSINKNMFFEKYKFLRIDEKKQRNVYLLWFVVKNYLLVIAGLGVVYYITKSLIPCQILVNAVLFTEFFRIDPTDWRLFERDDFVLTIPQCVKRTLVVLLGNLIYKIVINTNIFFYTVLLCVCDPSNAGFYPALGIAYIMVIVILECGTFFIRYSTLGIKKGVGFLEYIISMVVNGVFVYGVFEAIIYAVKKIAVRDFSMKKALVSAGKICERIIGTLLEYRFLLVWLAVSLLILFIGILWHTIRKLSDSFYFYKDESRYVIRNLWILNAAFIAFKYFSRRMKKTSAMTEKEFALFADIYKFNYVNTWFVYLPDRTISVLLAIAIVMKNHPFTGVEYVLLGLLPCFVILDIDSAISVKMVANMSFISDRNTLLVSNANGLSIKEILNSKMRFYYIMKSAGFCILAVMINLMMASFKCEWFIILFVNLMSVMAVMLMPRNYLINNLIFSRMDYKDYRRYLDESKLLDEGIQEFIPLNLFFKTMSIEVVATVFIFSIGRLIGFSTKEWIIVTIIIGTFMAGIVLCSVIMRRIEKNIINFIEKGDYSADLAKIFKE